jgi:hypothetical protein
LPPQSVTQERYFAGSAGEDISLPLDERSEALTLRLFIGSPCGSMLNHLFFRLAVNARLHFFIQYRYYTKFSNACQEVFSFSH